MKSNTAKGWGTKGSKFWMQMVASFPKLEKHFIDLINHAEGKDARNLASYKWISPIPSEEEEFKEYSLNGIEIETLLGRAKDSTGLWKEWPDDPKKEFWPDRQPQWDGILVYNEDSHKTIYIIEAKAYPEEMHTEISVHTEDNEHEEVAESDVTPKPDIVTMDEKKDSDDTNSYDMRVNSIKRTYKALSKGGSIHLWYGKTAEGKRIDFDGKPLKKGQRRSSETYNNKKYKYHSYYQLANRLTFLKYLRDEGYDVRLVLLNFVHDYTHGMYQGELGRLHQKDKAMAKSKAASVWKESYESAWRQMAGLSSAPADVLVIDYDICTVLPGFQFEYNEKTDSQSGVMTKYFSYKEDDEVDLKTGCFVLENGEFHCYTDENKKEKLKKLEKLLRG